MVVPVPCSTTNDVESAIQVTAIRVHELIQDIPVIQKEGLTTTDFEAVLKEIQKRTEFAWANVACIDQVNRNVKIDEIVSRNLYS